jgi:methyl-accepting chemotaxis protein
MKSEDMDKQLQGAKMYGKVYRKYKKLKKDAEADLKTEDKPNEKTIDESKTDATVNAEAEKKIKDVKDKSTDGTENVPDHIKAISDKNIKPTVNVRADKLSELKPENQNKIDQIKDVKAKTVKTVESTKVNEPSVMKHEVVAKTDTVVSDRLGEQVSELKKQTETTENQTSILQQVADNGVATAQMLAEFLSTTIKMSTSTAKAPTPKAKPLSPLIDVSKKPAFQ